MRNNIFRQRPIFFLCFFLLLLQFAFAQETGPVLKVAGRVTDRNQKPVPGVLIETESGSQKLVTEADGRFTLEAGESEYVSFTKEGFNLLRMAAKDIREGSVMLTERLIDGTENDEVFIPFGTRKKRQLTTAVSVLKGEGAPQIPFSSLTNILTGQLAGVYVNPVRTAPGNDAASILIRGRSSYNDVQAPLILVDGIERDFSDMDINEIESVSVLKDATALAWYGIRGANGVLLVTTRTGNAGNMKITLDLMGGVQTPKYKIQPLNSFTYATLYNEALKNDGFAPLYNQTALDGYRDGTDPYLYPDNNFVDRFFESSAPLQRYVGTISGGNTAVKYFTSFSYYNQGGLFAESKSDNYNSNAGYQRYNFRSNISAAVTDKLDITLNIGGRIEDRRGPVQLSLGTTGMDSLMNAIYLTPPNAYPLVNKNGSYGGNSIFTNNPLGTLKNKGYSSQVNRVLLASTTARYKMDDWLKGLSANVMYSYDYSGLYQNGRNENFDVYQENPATGAYTRFGGPRSALAFSPATFSNSIRSNELWAGFDYDRGFGESDLNMSLRYNSSAYFNPVANARFDFKRKGISYRASYGYQQRYFADVVLNYSGNDRFAPEHRYGLFPAASVGWVLSEENFLKSVPAIDYLKVRASYGSTGSENLYGARLYSWESLYNTINIPSYSFGTGFSSAGSATAEASLPNNDLSFERSNKLDIGVDAKFLSQALSLSIDFFIDRRKGLISPAFIPGFIGQTLVPENNGIAQYKGIESSVSYTKKIGRLQLNVFANYTYAKSNLVAYNDRPGLPENQRQTGHPLANPGLVYESEGIFQSQDEISKSPRQTLSGRIQPGDLKYRDVNNDGLIDNFDRSVLDYSTIPKGYYGFGASLNIAGFDLSFLFNGQHGGFANLNPIINSGIAANGFLNQYSIDRWSAATASTAIWPRLGIADRGNNTAPSTFWMRKSDFIQLRNVELGYTLPSKIFKRAGVESFRIYLNGYNIVAFGGLKDLDLSPDLVTGGVYGSYPYLASFSGGINVRF
ncbi:SusC/RagA family TonB-linked outer membrane protein [Flavitalea sp.]|nr:SusC/RagA family TonB-linked outer membrane protein [Flavitalea sp.]